MRTVRDIPEDQADALDRLAAEAGKSRAASIREASQELISSREPERDLDEFLGLRGPSEEDGPVDQERSRAKWPA